LKLVEDHTQLEKSHGIGSQDENDYQDHTNLCNTICKNISFLKWYATWPRSITRTRKCTCTRQCTYDRQSTWKKKTNAVNKYLVLNIDEALDPSHIEYS